MGVLHLWEILSSTGDQGKRISELSGKVLAVDLSMWILEFRKCEGTRHLYNLYLRNLFYRTLEFMKDGIQLIFVLDGLAPEIKHDKLKKQRESISCEMELDPDTSFRPYLERYSMECVKLIECLGLPWINSPGEAEEMCAYLDKKGIVDGCITKDSDFFCYGGETIYRNLRRECKLYVFDLFKMGDIESKLGYHRSDLVAMALLLGCDYNHGGVKNVGKDKAVTLIKTWKEKGIDPLKRILGWQENKELDEVELKTKSRSHKDPHCKKCGHKGNTQSHQRAGCSVCKTEADCNGSCDILCCCDWHREDQLIQKHKLEVTVRQRSRETNEFLKRSQKVVEEYMKPDLGIDVNKDDIVWRPVDMKALVDYLECKLYMSQAKVIEIITPVFIVSQLYQDGDELMFTPVRIERQCKHCGVLGYLVSWDKTDRNTWPMASCVEQKVDKRLFTRRFPHLVQEFEKRTASKAPAVKRKENMTSCKDSTTPQKKTISSGSQSKSRTSVDDKTYLQKQKFPSVTQFFTAQPSPDQKDVNKQTPSSLSQTVFVQSSVGHSSVSQSSIEDSGHAQTSTKKQAVDQSTVSRPSVNQSVFGQSSFGHTSIEGSAQAHIYSKKQAVDQPSVCQPSVSLSVIGQSSVGYASVSQSSIEGAALAQTSIQKKAVDQISVSQPPGSQSVFRQSVGNTSVGQTSIEGSIQDQTSIKTWAVNQPSVCQPSVSHTSVRQPTVGIKRQLNFSKTSPPIPKKPHGSASLSYLKTERPSTTETQGFKNKRLLKGRVKHEVKKEWNTIVYDAKSLCPDIINSAEPVIDLTEEEIDEEQQTLASSHTTNVIGSVKYPKLTAGNNKIAATSGSVIRSISELGSVRYPMVVNAEKAASRDGIVTVGNVVDEIEMSPRGLVTFQDQPEFEKLDFRLENRNGFELVEVTEEELNLSLI